MGITCCRGTRHSFFMSVVYVFIIHPRITEEKEYFSISTVRNNKRWVYIICSIWNVSNLSQFFYTHNIHSGNQDYREQNRFRRN